MNALMDRGFYPDLQTPESAGTKIGKIKILKTHPSTSEPNLLTLALPIGQRQTPHALPRRRRRVIVRRSGKPENAESSAHIHTHTYKWTHGANTHAHIYSEDQMSETIGFETPKRKPMS